MQQQQVIMQQPGAAQGAPQNIREFSSGLFGCCEDVKSCICGYFCMPCLLCSLTRRLDESCCVAFCLQGGLVALRTKIRTEYGIKGSICNDWCAICCCAALTVCQMDRELTHFGR